MKTKDGGVMDIQKAREAFERRQAKILNMPYKGLKAHFDENFRLFGARYNIGSINEKEWNLWLEAWQAAQAVPEGFVLVEKKLIKTLHEELLDHEPDSFVVNRDICELWKQAQEPANDRARD